MIEEDFKTANRIFNLLYSGIVSEFDSFIFKASVSPGYVEMSLITSHQGLENKNPKSDLDTINFHKELVALHESFKHREEEWKSVEFRYSKGGEVNTKFEYIDSQ